MKLSRHGVAVLLVLITASLGGMSLAVVAFGQDTGDPDATVPTGDYTGTTTSPYTVTTPQTTTTVVTPTSTTQTSTTQTSTGQSAPVTTNGSKPSRSHGTAPNGSGGKLPSKSTATAPTRMAFTGGEPLLIGAFGAMLMVSGVALHRRRRAARSDL
jgi:hypothetical protein